MSARFPDRKNIKAHKYEYAIFYQIRLSAQILSPLPRRGAVALPDELCFRHMIAGSLYSNDL